MPDLRLEAPLAIALPDDSQTLLVRACIGPPEHRDSCWTNWLRTADDPVAYLKQERLGIKAMLPLLYDALRKADVTLEDDLQTILRTAYAQEEIRAASFEEVSSTVLQAMTDQGPPFAVIRGADLAYTVYEDPILRHSDRLELVLASPGSTGAPDTLLSIGCSPADDPMSPMTGRDIADFRHPSGLTIRVRETLLSSVMRDDTLSAGLLQCTRSCVVAGVEIPVLKPEANVVFTCASVYDPTLPESPRWVCDVTHLLNQHPDFDWGFVTADLVAAHAGLPLWMTLRYLEQRLGLPIPTETLAQLKDAANGAPYGQFKNALSASRRSTNGGVRAIMRSVDGLRDRLLVAGWVLEEIFAPRHRR